MTVDREQILRELEKHGHGVLFETDEFTFEPADLRALLAELEQAEKMLALCAADTTAVDLAQDVEFLKAEKDDLEDSRNTWKDKAINAERSGSMSEALIRQLEARLAKVPALVEALREMLHRMETCDEAGCEAEQHITYEIRDALAVWDAEPTGPDTKP